MFPTLVLMYLAPAALMLALASLCWVSYFILTFIFCGTPIVCGAGVSLVIRGFGFLDRL